MSLFTRLARRIRGPRCHLKPEEKAWVEEGMIWLREQFGVEPIRRPPLDPASEALPRKWDSSTEAGEDLFARLCQHMRVDPSRVELQFYGEHQSVELARLGGERSRDGAAGLYMHPVDGGRLVIALDAAGLRNPANLTATICHELAHVHLLGDGRLSPDAEDGEHLTDLLTVYFGAGIFTANTVFQFNQWQDGQMQGWSASRHGYLPEAGFGYALACFAWMRGELDPRWRRHLLENIAYYFDDSLHYLSTTRDTSLSLAF